MLLVKSGNPVKDIQQLLSNILLRVSVTRFAKLRKFLFPQQRLFIANSKVVSLKLEKIIRNAQFDSKMVDRPTVANSNRLNHNYVLGYSRPNSNASGCVSQLCPTTSRDPG